MRMEGSAIFGGSRDFDHRQMLGNAAGQDVPHSGLSNLLARILGFAAQYLGLGG